MYQSENNTQTKYILPCGISFAVMVKRFIRIMVQPALNCVHLTEYTAGGDTRTLISPDCYRRTQ